MTRRIWGAAAIVAAIASSAAAPALTTSGTEQFRLVFIGTVNVAQNTASGTFTGSVGSFKDHGTWKAFANMHTLVDHWRIVGKRGTIIAADFSQHWTIGRGTKAYAGLHGNGGEISKDQPN